MIERKLVPNVNIFERVQPTKLDTGISYDMGPMRLSRIEKPETGDFKAVFSGLIENFNHELNAPDQLLKDLMQGNSNVDIHDVMTAMSKSEIAVNIATSTTTKIIQAYEKIMQIQL